MRHGLITSLGRTLAAAALGAALAIGSPAAAAQSGGASSASEAAAMVKSRSGARVLGVRTQQQGQRTTYRVKIITPKGVVRTVTVPHRRR